LFWFYDIDRWCFSFHNNRDYKFWAAFCCRLGNFYLFSEFHSFLMMMIGRRAETDEELDREMVNGSLLKDQVFSGAQVLSACQENFS
jgi:hypothetical protein